MSAQSSGGSTSNPTLAGNCLCDLLAPHVVQGRACSAVAGCCGLLSLACWVLPVCVS